MGRKERSGRKAERQDEGRERGGGMAGKIPVYIFAPRMRVTCDL